MPIVLSPKTELPDSVKKYVAGNKVTKAFVIGGTGVVSDNVMNGLPLAERVWGDDRYKTNIAVLKRFVKELSFDKVYVATGTGFADALSGSALVSKTSSSIILVDKTLDIVTADYMNIKLPYVKQLWVLGGEGVIPSSVLTNNVYGNTPGNISNFGLVATQGDSIYYNNNTLYKVNSDGTGKAEISKDQPVFINVVGEWVYYVEGSSKTNKMYKVRTDGTSKTKLSDERALDINVSGDWIYYITVLDSGEAEIHKVNKNGTDLTMLYGGSKISSLNVSGEYLYFDTSEVEGIRGSIDRVKIDGTDFSTVCSDAGQYINVSGDWLYYAASIDGNTIKVKTDGTQRQIVD